MGLPYLISPIDSNIGTINGNRVDINTVYYRLIGDLVNRVNAADRINQDLQMQITNLTNEINTLKVRVNSL